MSPEVVTADRQQARQLSVLPLMPAPAPGTERYLRTREIQDMLSAQGVDIGGLRFVGAQEVVIAAADGNGNSGNVIQASAEARTSQRVTPMSQHAAILAGATVEQVATQVSLDDARTGDIRKQVTSIIGNYLNVKTGRVQPWKVECDLSDREFGKLDAAASTPTCAGGSEPWIGRQRFLISFSTADGQVQLPIFAEISAAAGARCCCHPADRTWRNCEGGRH